MNLISKQEKKDSKLLFSQVFSIIGLVVCVIGGIIFISGGVAIISLNQNESFVLIALGVFTIIVAFSIFKFHFGGMLFCFLIGFFALLFGIYTSSYFSPLLRSILYIGPLITLIGSIIGLIGVFITSPAQIKKFGILVIILVVIILVLWLLTILSRL